MASLKPYILPVALLLGLILHKWVALVSWVVPFLVFAILTLNFSAVDLLRLRFRAIDAIVMLFQTCVSIGLYALTHCLIRNEILAQAALICVLCPVAASVVVISAALGADRATTTGYTIFGNMLVAVVAPVLFSFIGENQNMPFVESFILIFKHIASIIALPYFVVLALQLALPKAKKALSRLKDYALIVWALALLITLGKTIDFIFLFHAGNEHTIALLALMAVALCAFQFGAGRLIGRAIGDRISTAQLIGQKNTAMGIWMATVYLTPLASVVLAFYSICQNLFNSWQMWRYNKTSKNGKI